MGQRRPVSVPHEGHEVRVAAERPDVDLDPVKGGQLIEQGVVARGLAVSCAEETWDRNLDLSHRVVLRGRI